MEGEKPSIDYLMGLHADILGLKVKTLKSGEKAYYRKEDGRPWVRVPLGEVEKILIAANNAYEIGRAELEKYIMRQMVDAFGPDGTYGHNYFQ